MSRTLSMNSGFRESLNVSLRCGCSPKARQMRPTGGMTEPEQLLIHIGAFKLGLQMRQLLAIGTPSRATSIRLPVPVDTVSKARDGPLHGPQ